MLATFPPPSGYFLVHFIGFEQPFIHACCLSLPPQTGASLFFVAFGSFFGADLLFLHGCPGWDLLVSLCHLCHRLSCLGGVSLPVFTDR
jgi:hypothetical protein